MTEQPAPATNEKIVSQPATTIIQQAPSRRNMSWTVVAVIVGVLAGFGWNMIDFSESITIGEVTTQDNLEWANSILAAFVAGVAGFCLVLAIAPEQD